MSGARTKTGCYTCRIRKKKCGEQRPVCLNCHSRDIECHGYGAKPNWMNGMSSWKEIMASKEAIMVRESAQKTYKSRRTRGVGRETDRRVPVIWQSSEHQQASSRVGNAALFVPYHADSQLRQNTMPSKAITWPTAQDCNRLPRPAAPVPMSCAWWYESLPNTHLSLHCGMSLLTTFLDVVFPLQFGFHGLSETYSQSWFMQTLVTSEPFYRACLSLAVSFEWGKRSGNQNGDPDLHLDARRLQVGAIQGLQQQVNQLSSETDSGIDILRKGTKALSIMNQLLSLEVFSFIEGQWEIHLQAARTILGLFQNNWLPELFPDDKTACEFSKMGELRIGHRFTNDLKAFEFFVTSMAWVDVIAMATFGPPPFSPGQFNSLPLLRNDYLKTEQLMGCQSCILLAIAEITQIESWKNEQTAERRLSMIELVTQSTVLGNRLISEIQRLQSKLSQTPNDLKDDSNAVSMIFAYAALVYLHTIVSGSSPFVNEVKENVSCCLKIFEVFPTRLLIRNSWPFAITGCMATPDQYDRFRAIIARAVADEEPIGTTWKGLRVMEECWRLRSSQPGMWDLRNTMANMNMRVLLV